MLEHNVAASSCTPEFIESVGFEKIPQDEIIKAKFKWLSVYRINGVCSGKAFQFYPENFLHTTKDFTFSIGDKVNEICQALIG